MRIAQNLKVTSLLTDAITAFIFPQGLHGNIRVCDAEENFIKNYPIDTNNPFKIEMLGENDINITEL